MSIRTKLALILFLAVGLFLGLDLVLLGKTGAKTLAVLERSRCAAQIGSIERAFDEVYDELAALARTAEIDAGSNRGSSAGPAGPDPLRQTRTRGNADLAVSIAKDGTVVEYRFLDPQGTPGILREIPSEAVAPSHPLIKAWLNGTPPRGLMETRSGLMLIGSALGQWNEQPVLHVRGRWLGQSTLGRIRSLAGAGFSCRSLQDVRSDVHSAALPTPGETTIREADETRLIANKLMDGIRGFPVAAVETSVLRKEKAALKLARRQELLTALCVAIIFPLVLLILIQVVVTGPLKRLRDHASAIGESDDASQRLNMVRTDEIGVLASEFDRMLDKLEQSRRAQQKVARLSGRSDIATGVMHGVGNLVNSVNVAACMASDTISTVVVDDLKAIRGALVEHQGDLDGYLRNDPQGQHLLDFFGATLDSLESRVSTAHSEVSSVLVSVEAVKSLVQSLQGEETRNVVIERINVAEEVELALDRASLRDSSAGIRCDAVLDITCEVRLDRQRLEEILDEVLGNAKESLETVAASNRQLNVRVSADANEKVLVTVEDTGSGIAQDRLDDIFALDSTTKGEGRGRGLHTASIAASELGGRLSAWSAGPGQGAILTLELPSSTPATVNA